VVAVTHYDCLYWTWGRCTAKRVGPCNPRDCPVDLGRYAAWRSVVAQLPALDCACRAELAATRRIYEGQRVRQMNVDAALVVIVTDWWDQYLTLLEAAGWDPYWDPDGKVGSAW
jgi:hypothetical protein